MEKESNEMEPDQQVLWPILPHPCMPSVHSTPQGATAASVNGNVEEILVPMLDEFDLFEPTITTNEEEAVKVILKDLKGNDEFSDSFLANIGDIFKYVEPNDSSKPYISDNSNFVVKGAYEEPQIKNATAMDTDNILRTEDSNIGIQVRTNQIQVVQEAEYFTHSLPLTRNDVIQSIEYLQDVREETKYDKCHDKYNRKTNQEANDGRDDGGSNNKENFKTVNTQDECENESVDSIGSYSGTRNMSNDEYSSFKTRQSYNKGEKLHSCKVCGKQFTKYYLPDHERTHAYERSYACDVCNKRFNFESNLKRHLLLHKGERPYVCGTCNKTFTRKYCLKIHSDIHKDERPYTCSICDQSFRQKSNLFAHKKIHEDYRPFTCGICDKSFRRNADLRLHSKLHAGEKSHLCKLCDQSFRRKIELFEHSSIHTGVRPFVCNVCQKGFTRSTHLFDHLHLHTGKSPHQCKVCGKSFTQRSNLLRHSKLHTAKN